ncbi:hypothetical protein SZ55_1436 [Pseudomonas sp. FeS53a]|nr:hypothetical protein SZ55_1436 [Pseudomonas sp. FeS53a]
MRLGNAPSEPDRRHRRQPCCSAPRTGGGNGPVGRLKRWRL